MCIVIKEMCVYQIIPNNSESFKRSQRYENVASELLHSDTGVVIEILVTFHISPGRALLILPIYFNRICYVARQESFFAGTLPGTREALPCIRFW